MFSRGSGCKRRVDAEARGEDLLANLANPVTVQSRAQASAGKGVAAAVGGEQFGQVVEQRALLLAAGGCGGEGALGEPFAVV
jgi:hypothetical protein